MIYNDYYEMKANTGKISHDKENISKLPRNSRTSLKSGVYDERDTPFFVTLPSERNSERNLTEEQENFLQQSSTDKRVLEEHYRNLVKITIEQVDKLKFCKDEVYKHQEEIVYIEEEITSTAEKRVLELHERYKKAFKQLQDSFEQSVWKIKELDSQRKQHLKSKFDENKLFLSKLSSSIKDLESKIQLLPMNAFIENFDQEFMKNEEMLNNAPKNESFLVHQWKNFPIPEFKIIVNETQSQPLSVPDDFSIGMSLVKTDDFDPLSATARGFELGSPINANTNLEMSKDDFNFFGSSAFKMDTIGKENRACEKKRRGNSDGFRDLSPSILNAMRSPSNGNKIQNPIRIEDGSENINLAESHNSKIDGRIARHYSEGMNQQKQACLIPEEQKAQKKITYKEVIKKMQIQAKEKDKILQDMIKAYKELESKYMKATKEPKLKSSTSSNPNPHLAYEEILKPIHNNLYEQRTLEQFKPSSSAQPSRANSLKRQRIPPETKNKREFIDENGQVQKPRKENKKQDLLIETKNNEKINVQRLGRSSQTQKHSESHNFAQEFLTSSVTSPKVHLYYMTADNNQLTTEGEIDEIRIQDSNLIRRVRIYIPFGQPIYSNYYIVGIEKNSSADEVLHLLLERLGMNDSKAYRYYLSIQIREQFPEKTLLSSENVWNYLDSDTADTARNWPRFYLRSYDNKFYSNNGNA